MGEVPLQTSEARGDYSGGRARSAGVKAVIIFRLGLGHFDYLLKGGNQMSTQRHNPKKWRILPNVGSKLQGS